MLRDNPTTGPLSVSHGNVLRRPRERSPPTRGPFFVDRGNGRPLSVSHPTQPVQPSPFRLTCRSVLFASAVVGGLWFLGSSVGEMGVRTHMPDGGNRTLAAAKGSLGAEPGRASAARRKATGQPGAHSPHGPVLEGPAGAIPFAPIPAFALPDPASDAGDAANALPQFPRHRRMFPGELPGRFPFYWTRAIYSGWGRGWRGQSWAIDYPKGDQQFILVLKRLVQLDVYDWDNAVRLDDPDLRRFPVLYAVEVGGMELTEPEVEGLRGYLDAGGFLIVDDFWGNEWMAWEYNINRVFPDRPIVDIGLDHPLYSSYYDITEIKQVPARGRGIYGRPTEECYGCYPAVRGIYDDEGRLMVIINWNTDLGDAWEWAEDPSYPLAYSTYAYEMGANMIVYAMSH